MLLHEFLHGYRHRLAAAFDLRLEAVRSCNSLEELRRTQGFLDGIDLARQLFDTLVRETIDDPDRD